MGCQPERPDSEEDAHIRIPLAVELDLVAPNRSETLRSDRAARVICLGAFDRPLYG
jgi:hypothetical protein